MAVFMNRSGADYVAVRFSPIVFLGMSVADPVKGISADTAEIAQRIHARVGTAQGQGVRMALVHE